MKPVLQPIRRPGEWDPFMNNLFGEVRRVRRRRRIRSAAVALLLAVAVGALTQLSLGKADPLLRAEIPTADAPVFQPNFDEGADTLFFVVAVEEETA